jgi:hypothetical protein
MVLNQLAALATTEKVVLAGCENLNSPALHRGAYARLILLRGGKECAPFRWEERFG